MTKRSKSKTDSTASSLNTETQPTDPSVPSDTSDELPPCTLCLWFEKRLKNTIRENVKHMEKYHVS